MHIMHYCATTERGMMPYALKIINWVRNVWTPIEKSCIYYSHTKYEIEFLHGKGGPLYEIVNTSVYDWGGEQAAMFCASGKAAIFLLARPDSSWYTFSPDELLNQWLQVTRQVDYWSGCISLRVVLKWVSAVFFPSEVLGISTQYTWCCLSVAWYTF